MSGAAARRPPSHALAALRRANEVRLEHAAVGREMRAGELTIGEALEDPRAQRMFLGQLVIAKPRWGGARMRKLLKAALGMGSAEQWRVERLTERQRRELRRHLDGE